MHLDVRQAGIGAHKIHACKSLRAGILLLGLLALVPSAALAEDTAPAVAEVFLVVVINQQEQGVAFLLLQLVLVSVKPCSEYILQSILL